MAINPTDILKDGNPIKKIGQFKLFIQMMKDHFSKKYTELASWVLPLLIIGLVYLLSPIDFISDFIPLVGWVDDVAIVGIIYKLISKEITKYETWRKNNTQS